MMRQVWLVGAVLMALAGCSADRGGAANRYQADAYLRAAAPTSYPSEYDIPAPAKPSAPR